VRARREAKTETAGTTDTPALKSWLWGDAVVLLEAATVVVPEAATVVVPEAAIVVLPAAAEVVAAAVVVGATVVVGGLSIHKSLHPQAALALHVVFDVKAPQDTVTDGAQPRVGPRCVQPDLALHAVGSNVNGMHSAIEAS
jgi:hypothetical protein